MEIATVAGKMNAGAARLRIVGLVLILFAFVLFIYFTRKQEQHIETQKTEITQKDAVIDQKSVALEKVAVVDVRRDEIAKILTEYNKLRDKHDTDGLDGLYADQLDQYFKNLKNTPKAEVKKADEKYWKSFPLDKFSPVGDPAISVNEDGTAKAMLNGRNCRDPKTCTDQLVQINFNAENKITSVRGFIPNG